MNTSYPMLALLWTIFTVSASIIFIFLCFKSIGLIKKELGIAAAFVFTVGMLSTCSGYSTIESKNETFTKQFSNTDTVVYESSSKILLDKNWVNKLHLFYKVVINRFTNERTVIHARTALSGVSGPIEWVPQSVNVYFSSNETMRYEVHGDFKWNLFRFPVITNGKEYTGKIEF